MRKTMIRNGDIMVSFYYYNCAECKSEIPECHTHFEENGIRWCWDCAFIVGKIDKKTFATHNSLASVFNAGVHNGKIEYWMGNETPPWERTPKQQRNTPKYRKWRTDVFERDNYTCQDCGQHGGELNAHHIKQFAKYPKLRYVVNNGVTLCVDCHKKRHKKEKVC